MASMKAARVAALAGKAGTASCRHQDTKISTSALSALSVLGLNAPRAASK